MITRRRWLKRVGLGAGASLLAPFMTQLAWAQGAAPKRFLFIVEGNGFEPVTVLCDAARAALDARMAQPIGAERWWWRRYAHDAPIEVAGGLETAPALANLGALAERTSVLFGLSSRITGGGHSARHGALASARTTGGSPGGITIDAWLGAQASVRRETPFDVVRLGVGSDPDRPLDFGTCAWGQGRGAPLLLKPDQAFRALFGSVGDGDAARVFAQRGAQLDFAAADVRAALQVFGGGTAERAKLEAYLDSIEALQARRARLVDIDAQLRAARPAPVGDAVVPPLERFAQQLDLAAAALLGGLTNVCVVGCGSGGDFGITYPNIIRSVGRHDLHHGSAGNPQFLAAIHAATRTQLDAISAVARRLAAAPDIGGGSVLDNTLIVYVGDNGEQHHSTASDFPVVLMGGEGMGLRAGRTVALPGMSADGHRQLSNLWNTVGHLAGVELNDFGAEGRTRRALGPIEEVLA